MTWDLRTESWIPWKLRDGTVEWGPPARLVEDWRGSGGVVGISTPRPDFDGALLEFLIGLLTVALPARSDSAWEAYSRNPPSRADLDAALEELPPAFDLDGEGPRFLQDFSVEDLSGAEVASIEQLLIDTPGAQTVRQNRDLFTKRERAAVLGRPAAAMALLTLQTYAPSGGQGHRTSLRGGGPLTTLVHPYDGDDSLWSKLWANVETLQQLERRSVRRLPDTFESAFPWLAPTRVSNGKGTEARAAERHPAEAYFGMPRRIRLEFSDGGVCDLTGRPDERTVVGFRMRNYGVNYADWEHPLTPLYRQNTTSPWLPVHGQPGGLAWKDWAALTVPVSGEPLRRPAAVVTEFASRFGVSGQRRLRLHAFGYDMDNMKARAWTEAEMPLLITPDAWRRDLLSSTARALTEATRKSAAALIVAVKTAQFGENPEVKGEFRHIGDALWEATESTFYDVMTRINESGADQSESEKIADASRRTFMDTITEATLDVFDRLTPADGLSAEGHRRRVAARYGLTSTLRGYSKIGEEIFGLMGLPLPGGGRKVREAARRKTTKAERI